MGTQSNKLNFTMKALNALPSVSKRTRFYDSKVEGLVARKLPSGRVVIGVYRKFNGKPIDFDICKLSDDMTMEWIRNQARDINGKLAKGIDPREDKRKKKAEQQVEVLTFKVLAEEYLASLLRAYKQGEKAKSAYLNAESTFRNHVYTLFGSKTVEELDVVQFNNVFRDYKTPAVFNKIVTYSKAALNMAVENNRIAKNPLIKLEKVNAGDGRKRVIKGHELKSLLNSIKQEKQIYQDVIWVLMLTAARKSNVLSMKWSEISIEDKVWLLRVKGNKTHTIHLSDQVCEILARRFQGKSSPFVFPSDRSQTGHISEKSSKGSFWRRVTERAGLYSGDRDENLTIHDLRRTLATLIINNGGDIAIVKDLLGHSDISITAKSYAHIKGKRVHDAVQQVSDMYDEVLKSSN